MAAEFKLDGEVLEAMITKTIVDSLSEEKRQEIISQAVKMLMVPRKPYGGDWRTPETTALQDAFSTAVLVLCRKIADEMVTQNEQLVGQIRTMIGELMAAAVSGEGYNGLRGQIADAVRQTVETALERAGRD